MNKDLKNIIDKVETAKQTRAKAEQVNNQKLSVLVEEKKELDEQNEQITLNGTDEEIQEYIDKLDHKEKELKIFTDRANLYNTTPCISAEELTQLYNKVNDYFTTNEKKLYNKLSKPMSEIKAVLDELNTLTDETNETIRTLNSIKNNSLNLMDIRTQSCSIHSGVQNSIDELQNVFDFMKQEQY